MKKEDINKLKQQLEEQAKSINIKEQEFLDLEKSAEKKFLKDIKGYVNHKKYENIKEYIKIITNPKSRINCLILKSEQGLGKTTIVKNILKELKKDILYINSYSTALSFYKLVYHNRFKHIVLDDVYGLYSDEKGIAIIRALTNTEKVRYIKYESTSDKLDVPSSFIFEGSVIILTNKITPEMDNSLLGRAIYREIKFSLSEKLEFMEKIAKFHYNLKENELKEIMDFIRENVDETTKNFTFRSVLKIIEFYKNNKDNWKKLGLEELEKDDMLVLVKELIETYYTAERQVEEFVKLTGKSRRTFFRLKKKLVPKCHSVKNA